MNESALNIRQGKRNGLFRLLIYLEKKAFKIYSKYLNALTTAHFANLAGSNNFDYALPCRYIYTTAGCEKSLSLLDLQKLLLLQHLDIYYYKHLF